MLEAGHLCILAFTFSARPFCPFLSVLHKKHTTVSINREAKPLHKVFVHAWKSLGEQQAYICASSKLNISGAVSALRPANIELCFCAVNSPDLFAFPE